MTKILTAIMILTLTACSEKFVKNTEAIDDPTAYEMSVEEQAKIKWSVKATAETLPVRSAKLGADTADDPAIWYNASNPEASVIYGTNKQEGIHAYDLDGNELQHLPYGKVNNIDIRQDVLLGGKKVDILAGSNRTTKSIDLFVINEDGHINNQPDYVVDVSYYMPYGFCLYKDANSELHTFFNDKYGYVLQHKITLTEEGTAKATKVRRVKLQTQAEGMVVDDLHHMLYISEEQTAIHTVDLSDASNVKTEILAGSTKANRQIRFDWEGLALLPPHYLVASSQGNFSYAIFDLQSRSYVKSFVIGPGTTIDGAEETDGLDILARPLGNTYPQGVLVVQDGFNKENGLPANQNFKIVDLRAIETHVTQ